MCCFPVIEKNFEHPSEIASEGIRHAHIQQAVRAQYLLDYRDPIRK
jgi:hypothetical protein